MFSRSKASLVVKCRPYTRAQAQAMNVVTTFFPGIAQSVNRPKKVNDLNCLVFHRGKSYIAVDVS